MASKDERVKVEVFLFSDEFEALKEHVKKEHLPMSEYGRLAILSSLVLDGNKKAISLTAKRASQFLARKLRSIARLEALEAVQTNKKAIVG
jgi:hypothetical protein